jgi:GNAT superfamily N-acetyltransferase
VLALVVPAAPERSVLNCVTYEHSGALLDAYPAVAAAYDAIGAQWTVWVPPADEQAAALLAERGHVLDAQPEAMARTLDRPPARPPLEDWTAEGSMEDVAEINDLAYGYEGSFARALSGLAGDGVFVYVARVGGRPAGCLLTVDLGSNTEIEWVAVLSEARGRGLSGKLLAHALADAAERGQQTSTLIASQLGRPVYERFGYRPAGALQMWERRRPLT